jgi:hypothetical protein
MFQIQTGAGEGMNAVILIPGFASVFFDTDPFILPGKKRAGKTLRARSEKIQIGGDNIRMFLSVHPAPDFFRTVAQIHAVMEMLQVQGINNMQNFILLCPETGTHQGGGLVGNDLDTEIAAGAGQSPVIGQIEIHFRYHFHQPAGIHVCPYASVFQNMIGIFLKNQHYNLLFLMLNDDEE